MAWAWCGLALPPVAAAGNSGEGAMPLPLKIAACSWLLQVSEGARLRILGQKLEIIYNLVEPTNTVQDSRQREFSLQRFSFSRTIMRQSLGPAPSHTQ